MGSLRRGYGEVTKVNKEYRVDCRNLLSHDDMQDSIERRQKNWSTIKTMKTKEMV
jgi:hypothetical protein